MRRKYSKALRSFCATPSPSAYILPSFHCAKAWPFSAAYSSAWRPFSVSPDRSDFAPERNASIGVIAGADAIESSDLLPSNAIAGATKRPTLNRAARNRASNIRIALFLGSAARLGDRAFDGGADLLGVFPQITGASAVLAWLPILLARRELRVGKLDVERAGNRIDLYDIAILDQSDRPANRSFRSNMADAESARGAGETAVCDQRNLLALALAVKRGRGRKHFAHAGAAFRPLITDHQHVAGLVSSFPHRFEASFLAVEATRRA